MDYEKRALKLRKRIAILGVTHGLSQKNLADRMGISDAALSYALTGKREQPWRLDEIKAWLDKFEESEKVAA